MARQLLRGLSNATAASYLPGANPGWGGRRGRVLDVRGLRDRPDQTLSLSESLVGVWKKPGLTEVVSEAGRGAKGDNLARM